MKLLLLALFVLQVIHALIIFRTNKNVSQVLTILLQGTFIAKFAHLELIQVMEQLLVLPVQQVRTVHHRNLRLFLAHMELTQLQTLCIVLLAQMVTYVQVHLQHQPQQLLVQLDLFVQTQCTMQLHTHKFLAQQDSCL